MPNAPIMTAAPRRALWLVPLALLVACGGGRTTGPATQNPAPSPVDTSPATVAATPTPTRVVVSGGVAVTERTGRCRVTVPGGFSEEPPRSGTFVSRDRLAFAGLEALDASAAPFETVTGAAIAGVQELVTGYQETDAAREQDGLRVDFTGALGGRPGRGMVYFKQAGPTICQSTLIVAEGSSIAYDAAFQALTATLAATNAAAAAWPTPTVPRAPTATRTPTAAAATREIRYLAMGDSYTYGTGASDPATRSSVARFTAHLRDLPGATVTTTNLAVPGATSADLLGDYPARGPASQGQLGQGVRLLAEGRANLVTIAIGGNDILRLLRPGQICSGDAITSDPCLAAMQESVRTLSTPNVPRILEALVDAARSGTQIIVLTYPNAFSVGAGDLREQRTDLAIATLNGVIADAVAQLQPRATGRGVRLATVDLFPLFAGKAGTLTHILRSPPDIHPTDEGYAVIADAIARAYQPPQAAQPGTAAAPTPAAARVSFPRDEAPHDAPTEWWYYTGHLRTDDGARFGFQSVLFRVRRGGAPVVHAAHVAITDHARSTFAYDQRLGAAQVGAGYDLRLGDWAWRGAEGKDHLEARLPGYAFSLDLAASKPPALHRGGYIDFGAPGSSYYYSRTRMAVRGTVEAGGAPRAVSGEAWFDHQWGDFEPFGAWGWDWWGLQLAGGSEVMLALVHSAAGETMSLFGSSVEPDGRVVAIERADIQIEALGRWTSPRTGVTYPAGWRIALPRQGLALSCTPVLADQELDARSSTQIIYWEGEVRCEGSRGGAPVAGDGHVELIGYDRR